MERCVKYLPPGCGVRGMWIICVTHLAATVWTNMVFFSRWRSQLSKIELWAHRIDVSAERAGMPDLERLISGCLYPYLTLVITMLAAAGVFYLSFYMESRSIWLMRRLPDRWELHFRCLAFPLAALLAGAVLCAVLLAVDRYVYVTYTPPEYIGNSTITAFTFWRALLIGGTA